MRKDDIDFATFFAMWGDLKGWKVPSLHIRICDWLDSYGPEGLLMIFRGASKSTIVAVYEAYRLWKNPRLRFLDWAADDSLATKLTRDVRDVLTRHPLTQGMLEAKPAEHQFWVSGADDFRNASVSAYGVMSNVTGSRADEIVLDDAEVPRNIASADLREKLRMRVSDGTYILVPGGKTLYIGTPHCHDSIYNEVEGRGADVLKIPLFEHNQRNAEAVNVTHWPLTIPHDDLIVFHGNRALVQDTDFRIVGDVIEFASPMSGLLDAYSECAWPERFTWEEVKIRRRAAFSLNEWDSQYMLRAKPIHDVRLNPDRLRCYDVEPKFTEVNNTIRCEIGFAKITTVRAYWDVASGKAKGDASVLSIVFGDDKGYLYWHRAIQLLGEIESQCDQARKLALEFSLPAIIVETNGIGGFVPAFLRRKLAGTHCAVIEHTAKGKKSERIIAALEPPLSGNLLYAHEQVFSSPAIGQMRDFIPDVDGPDDFIDSASGAILAQPVRIGRGAYPAQRKSSFGGQQQYEATVLY